MEVAEVRFRVMASDAQVILVGPQPHAADRAEERLRELEQRWSRFIDDSDISRLNRSQGEWLEVHPDTIALITTMQEAAADTGGLYDPTMLFELLDAGYTASVEDAARLSVLVDLPCPGHSVHEIVMDGTRVCTPPTLGLDPGGIGKGLAADLVVAEIMDGGTGGALVSVGGDLVAAGSSPHGAGWFVDVEDPHLSSASVTQLELESGGVATSSTNSRAWLRHGVRRHHVLDPRIRAGAATDITSVTVVGRSGWLAEAHATAAIVQPWRDALRYFDDRELTGIIVTDDRRTIMTGLLATEDAVR